MRAQKCILVRVALAALAGLSSVQCARIAGLGDGDGSEGLAAPGSAPADISPATLDFGDVGCGAASLEKLITIHNKGAGAASYKVQVPEGAAFAIAGALEGTVGAGRTITLSATASPTLAGDNASDIVITAGDALQTVHATARGTGPALEFSPSVVAFGEVRKEAGGAPVDVKVRNSGTADLVVPKMTADNPLFTATGLELTVPAGGEKTFQVELAKSGTDDAMPVSGLMKPTIRGLCGAVPTLALTGKRVTADATVSSADWGEQDCNTAPDGRDLVVSNYSTMRVDFTLTPAMGSAFDIAGGLKGFVDPGSGVSPTTALVHVTPKPMPATAPLPEYNEKLHFSFTGGVKDERDANLHVKDVGSFLLYTPAALDFKADGSLNVAIANPGNKTVQMTFLVVNSTGGSWTTNPLFPVNIGGGAVFNGNVTFKATKNGPVTAVANPIVTGSGARCNPFGGLPLSGTH